MNKEEIRTYVLNYLGIIDHTENTAVHRLLDAYLEKGYTNHYWLIRRIKKELNI